MTVRLLHLSDTHLSGGGAVRFGIDADRSLAYVLDACAHLDGIGAVVVTGDIADDGARAAYDRARTTLLDFAGARGAHLIMCPGNHDDRAVFVAALGAGHFGRAGEPSGDPGPSGWACAVSTVAGLRLVTLDTLVPGKWFGRVGRQQLEWLTGLLAADPTVPTVVALHHAPVDTGHHIQRRVGLEDAQALTTALRIGNVVAVLAGHFHQQIGALVAGVPIWVTPGVCNRFDHLSGPAGSERAVAGGAATLIDLTNPATALFAVIASHDPDQGRELYSVTAAEIAPKLEEFGLPA